MELTDLELTDLARKLHQALRTPRQMEAPVTLLPGLNVSDAYRVQLEGLKLRQADGEKLTGLKIGLTSRAMQNLLGVGEPDFGHLTDAMCLAEGRNCPLEELLQPKVEGEIAFFLKKPLTGPGVTVAEVYEATAYVLPALEIVDSRVTDWGITLPDTVADNGSSAKYVLGGKITRLDQVDLRLTGMILEKNGELVNSGCGAEVLGHPAAAVAWLANKMAEFGSGLKAGQLVLSGALTAALPAAAGDSFTASFQGLGSVGVRFI